MTTSPTRGQSDQLSTISNDLCNRIRKNLKRLRPWATREGISCYRVYDRDIPQIPLSIDLYETALHGSVWAKNNTPLVTKYAPQLVASVASDLTIDSKCVFVKQRERQTENSQYEKVAKRRSEFVVHEGGYRFIVNLSDYLDTGLFLDLRRARRIVGNLSNQKHVLNLFAYTGSFTVYAAGGGAASTTTVDLSNTYLDWAARNLEMNGLAGPNHRIEKKDVNSFLVTDKPPPGGYDIAVLDAPTISRSKSFDGMFDVQRDHNSMLRKTLELMRPGGTVFFATNFRKFKPHFAGLEAHIEEISKQTVPHDFRDKRFHRSFRLCKM